MAAKTSRKDQYVGQTQRFLRDGFGVYNYSNKFFRYEGEWKKGRKHGHGKFVMGDGSHYEGQFKDGEIEGYGFKYYASNNNSYTGEFHQGEPHGQGVYKYKDGMTYEGAWDQGKRSGYGTLKAADNCCYEGFFHENMRHGEGAQTYSNGDRYDGDWVLDKRQGHGELRQRDGTIYDGQWRQDMKNGQGCMIHCSGLIYEGIWINNFPATMPTKIVVVMETNEIEEDECFTISVECQNDDGEVIEDDKGRELQVSAGFKWQPPKDASQTKERSGLFDVIEDFEEKPITTPFGYDVVSYPLTDQLSSVSITTDLTSSSQTESSSGVNLEGKSKCEGEDEVSPKEPVSDEKDLKDSTNPVPVAPGSPKPTTPVPNSPVDGQEGEMLTETMEDTTETGEVKSREDTPLPPPVTSKRTELGRCLWDNLRLAPPPPMYRPFLMLDEAQKNKKTKEKGPKSTEEDKNKAKKPGEDVIRLRPGEYVLMVHDVTTPAFMGKTLEPAFALLTIKKKKKPIAKKETKQNWDTRQFITNSMIGGAANN